MGSRLRLPLRLPIPIVLLLCLALAACGGRTTSTTFPEVGATLPPEAASPAAAPTADATADASGNAAAVAYPITLTDAAGRRVEVEAEPRRIVSLAPSNTEIVCALGACDHLVGVTDFDDYPPQVADVEDVVIGAAVDVEKVVAAEPDLVLAAGNEQTPAEVIDQIAELDLTVLVLYPETLEEVYADIELVGRALGRTDAATELVADMERRVAAVADAVEGADRPRVFYEVFYSEAAIFTAGEGSFLASLIEVAGAEPVVGDALGNISAEEVIAADPELILLGDASYDPTLADPVGALHALHARPGWGAISAVVNERVVPYTDDIVTTRPGPRIVDGLEALARAIHPDRVE